MIARIDSLTVQYGALRALDGVTFELPAGATGLLGPNGAGKSTLLKTMLGFVTPAAGSAWILGWDAARDPLEVRSRVGYMPESDASFPGLNAVEATALMGELAGLSRIEALSRGHEVLAYVGLGETRYRPVAGYSAGLKARVKLAQALMADPDLLLLDEPTNGLDPQGRGELLGLIRDISRRLKINVLLSTHLLPDVEEICDHAVLVDRGRLIVSGSIRELRALRERRWELRAFGDVPGFTASLRAAGASVEGEGPDLLVRLGQEEGSEPILKAAVAASVELRRLRVQERSLAEVFVDAVRAAAPAAER